MTSQLLYVFFARCPLSVVSFSFDLSVLTSTFFSCPSLDLFSSEMHVMAIGILGCGFFLSICYRTLSEAPRLTAIFRDEIIICLALYS